MTTIHLTTQNEVSLPYVPSDSDADSSQCDAQFTAIASITSLSALALLNAEYMHRHETLRFAMTQCSDMEMFGYLTAEEIHVETLIRTVATKMASLCAEQGKESGRNWEEEADAIAGADEEEEDFF